MITENIIYNWDKAKIHFTVIQNDKSIKLFSEDIVIIAQSLCEHAFQFLKSYESYAHLDSVIFVLLIEDSKKRQKFQFCKYSNILSLSKWCIDLSNMMLITLKHDI